MRYKIYAKTKDVYFIKHYINSYDYKGIKKRIRKKDFLSWRSGKIDMTDPDEVEDRTKPTIPKVEITELDRKVIDYLLVKLENDNYIIERDIQVDGVSKAKTKEVLGNSKLLERFKLRRVRANKENKQQLGITIKGYPFIIAKTTN